MEIGISLEYLAGIFRRSIIFDSTEKRNIPDLDYIYGPFWF
jgi:hypothetical protein